MELAHGLVRLADGQEVQTVAVQQRIRLRAEFARPKRIGFHLLISLPRGHTVGADRGDATSIETGRDTQAETCPERFAQQTLRARRLPWERRQGGRRCQIQRGRAVGTFLELGVHIHRANPGTPSRIRLEKSTALSADLARVLIWQRSFSSATGRLVVILPRS